MEYFSSDNPFAPSAPSYFYPTGLLCLQLIILAMAPLSALMHIAFIMGTWRLRGIGARSAYLVLTSAAFLGLSFTLSTFVITLLGLIGLKWNDCFLIWRIAGAAFIATGLSTNFFHSYLLLQRMVCIFLPLTVNTILCRQVILICFSIVVLFYVGVFALCLSPFTGVAYIPKHDIYILLKMPYSLMLLRANHITNYVVMLSSVIACPLMLLAAKLKLRSCRSSKDEMRLTIQVAMSVGIEVLFFVMFEFVEVEGASRIVTAKVSNLWYYNALTLPYLIMNRKIHNELKRFLFCRKRDTIMVITNPKPPPSSRQ